MIGRKLWLLTNLLYRATPESFCGSLAEMFWMAASSLVLPVLVGGAVAVPDIASVCDGEGR